jgi:ribosome-binding protein aMBF1 (putative translation factor)
MTEMEKQSQNVASKKSETKMQQPTGLISWDALWARLTNGPAVRSKFVESHLSKNIAFQVRAMRARNDWSQQELADTLETNQNAIYRLENPSKVKPTLSTLKKVAAAFDVALIVRFVPFSQLVNWVTGTEYTEKGLSTDSLAVPSFAEECGNIALGSILDLKEHSTNLDEDLGLPLGKCLGPHPVGGASASAKNNEAA